MTKNERKLLVMLEEFQEAERRYTEAVNDLVQAEIRRDVAKREKDECYARLERARAKYSDGELEDPPNIGKAKGGKAELGSERRKGGKNTAEEKRKQDGKSTFGEEAATPAKSNKVSPLRKSLQIESPSKSKGSSAKEPAIKKSPSRTDKSSSIMKQQQQQAPNHSVSPPRKSFKKLVAIEPLSAPVNVLDICKGRTREWLDRHLDCDRLGLVRNFFKASFGTRTNPDTKKLAVSTILISDEWNVLANTTAEVQELYIGVGANSSGSSNTGKHQTNLRDKVAEVLAAPQTESIALFYAPKKKYSHVYYGGHWRVKRGKLLDPPKMVMGQMRQCYLKLTFVGLNQALVDAINGDDKAVGNS